jgi:hypothetical protein
VAVTIAKVLRQASIVIQELIVLLKVSTELQLSSSKPLSNMQVVLLIDSSYLKISS